MNFKYARLPKEYWEKTAKRYYYNPALAAKQLRMNVGTVIYWWDRHKIEWRTKNREYIEAEGRRWRKKQAKLHPKSKKRLLLGSAQRGGAIFSGGKYYPHSITDEYVPQPHPKFDEDKHWAEEILDEI